YWVRVSSSCNGGSINSATATVTVQCTTAQAITTQPASRTINSGHTTTLSVTANSAGTTTYQWYQGVAPSTATPVGSNSPSFTTPALTATKSYWVRVTSTCNGTATANSNAATVTVVPPQIVRRQTAAATAWSQQSITATWPQATQASNLLVAVV